MTKNEDVAKAALEAIDKAEIPKTVAAPIYGVTRNTLYLWRRGGGISNEVIARTASRITGAIQKALANKELPLRKDMDAKTYLTELRNIIRRNA